MALEINEIDIRMQVREGSDQTRQQREEPQQPGCGGDREEIVQDCVRRVLQIMKTLRER